MISKQNFNGLRFLSVMSIVIFASCSATAQSKKQLVRLALIQVDSNQVNSYNNFLREEIELSIQKEPGVLTLYAIGEKENPERVTLFETYSDSSQYKLHLTTPHFQKYKQGTLDMVRHLKLIETQPILYHRKNALSKTRIQDLFIRLIKMEIDSTQIQNFARLATDVMLPGLRKEPGVLVMYAVSQKLKPSQVTILEVYTDAKAYEAHTKTLHFIKYKDESKEMVLSLKLVDAVPILLGSKPQ
jgi:quinol monooxygenase YgiN